MALGSRNLLPDAKQRRGPQHQRDEPRGIQCRLWPGAYTFPHDSHTSEGAALNIQSPMTAVVPGVRREPPGAPCPSFWPRCGRGRGRSSSSQIGRSPALESGQAPGYLCPVQARFFLMNLQEGFNPTPYDRPCPKSNTMKGRRPQTLGEILPGPIFRLPRLSRFSRVRVE